MKTLTTLAALFIAPMAFANSNAGGMDGGGGGTLPAQPATIYQVREIAEEAKSQLLFLFNGYEERQTYANASLDAKLFGGPKKVQEVLKGLRLEVRDDRPCLTSQGTEVDASVHASKQNTICLSAFRIAPKLDVQIAEREIIALLMHEVSHFMGATEKEARDLQETIAFWLTRVRDKIDVESALLASEEFTRQLSGAVDLLKASKLEQAKDRLNLSLLHSTKWEGASKAYPFSIFPVDEEEYFQVLRLKLRWANTYLQTEVPGPHQRSAKDLYDEMFNGRDHFLAEEDAYFPASSPYRSTRIDRLNSLPELLNQLIALEREFDLRAVYTRQVAYGFQWIKLDGARTELNPNPWKLMAGEYLIETVNCNSKSPDQELKKFAVKSSGSEVFLEWAKDSMWGRDQIRLGNYNVNTTLNQIGTYQDGSVFMLHEYGGQWHARVHADMTSSEFRLKRLAGNRFEATRINKSLSRDVSARDHVSTCVFTGQISQ